MGSDHKHHHHHHGHNHAHGKIQRLSVAFFLNFSFAIIELIGGFYTNSVAIISGALHDFGDCVAILLAILLEKWSDKKSDDKYSYGYRRYSPLAAMITGFILILGSVFVIIEAIPRLINPVQPRAEGMVILALFGIAVNGFAAYRVSQGTSLNERMVMWHLMQDALGWILVLASGLVMMFWKVPQLDAGLACVLALWILYNVFKNLKEAFKIFLQAIPNQIDQENLLSQIKDIPLVKDLHHFHLWSLDGERHVFTTHLVLADQVSHEQIDRIKEAVKKIASAFHIVESTIEIEFQSTHCVDPTH